MQIYLLKNGQQVGPYTVEVIRGMLSTRHIALTDQAWHEGLTDWQPLNTFLPSPPKPTATFPAYAPTRPVQVNVNQGASISVPRSKSSAVKKIFIIVFGSTLALILIVCALSAAGIIDTKRVNGGSDGLNNDPVFKVGFISGTEMARKGMVEPSDKEMDALARYCVNKMGIPNDKRSYSIWAWKQGFSFGWRHGSH